MPYAAADAALKESLCAPASFTLFISSNKFYRAYSAD